MNNKIKRNICKNWINNDCKFMKHKKKCNFAHGKSDIIKYECLNGVECWNDKCDFNHPKSWNPYVNKKECLNCINGYCDKQNNKYNHIKVSDINNINRENIKKELPNFEKDFPKIVKNNNKEIYNYTYSEILTSNLKNDLNIETKNIDDVNNEMIKIRYELREKYIYLKKLNPNDWVDYDEIDKTKEEIIHLKDKYNKNKTKDKINDIFDDELNLDIIFMNDNNEYNKVPDVFPDIKLTINGIEIDNMIENSILKNKNKNRENEDIEILIKSMKNQINNYNKQIKKYINNIVKDDHLKYILTNNLNEILFKINLFENNYKDIKEMI